MTWILIFSVLIIALFLYLNYRDRKKNKDFISQVQEQWGAPKDDEHYNFDQIEKYFQNVDKDNPRYFQIISDRIANDLDLHALFEFIDRTSSKIGQQFLYYKLRAIKSEIGLLQHFDSFVNGLLNDDPTREKIQTLLKNIDRHESYYVEELIHGARVNKPKWFPLAYLFSFLSIIFLFGAIAFPWLIIAFFPVFIINMVFHYWNKRNINYYRVAAIEFSKCINICEEITEFEVIKSYFPDLSFLDKIRLLKRKLQYVSFEKKVGDDPTSIAYSLIELIKIAFNAEIILTFRLIESLKEKGDSIHDAFRFIGEVDSAISIASLRFEMDQYCTPVFKGEKQLILKSVKHPLIQDCIANDLSLDHKSLLLTGSNMSGKTTFIRTVAINALFAQTIYTCFATYYAAPFMKVYSSIRISDDILQERSYYLEEVLTIKEFIRASEAKVPCLFTLDELFKGTNTLERISGGKAVLSYLNRGPNFVLVATHDIELTDLLHEEFDLYHFTEKIEYDELFFDHKIKEGPLTTRNAIKILELSEFPETVISDALQTLKAIQSDPYGR